MRISVKRIVSDSERTAFVTGAESSDECSGSGETNATDWNEVRMHEFAPSSEGNGIKLHLSS